MKKLFLPFDSNRNDINEGFKRLTTKEKKSSILLFSNYENPRQNLFGLHFKTNKWKRYFIEWMKCIFYKIGLHSEVYDEDDDGKCEGRSFKGKPITSYFTLMYRACRLVIKCTTNIDIFPLFRSYYNNVKRTKL